MRIKSVLRSLLLSLPFSSPLFSLRKRWETYVWFPVGRGQWRKRITFGELGGYGELGHLRLQNEVFLAKWFWHLPCETDSLRHTVTVRKHDFNPFQWLSTGVKGTFQNPWKHFVWATFLLPFWWGVGWGEHTFWRVNRWKPLFTMFHCFYHLSSFKHCFISNFLVWLGSSFFSSVWLLSVVDW